MDLDEAAPALRKLRLEHLRPILQKEVIELASEMGYEKTITASSSLDFIFKLYQAERTSKEAREERLKKAEDLILRLASLQHAIRDREDRRRKAERKKKVKLRLIEGSMVASEKTRKLLASIGIEDESIAMQAEAMLGQDAVETRVDLVKEMHVQLDIIKKLFAAHPETILITNEYDFLSELDTIETKREAIDIWSRTNERPPPIWADYNETPGILLDEFHDISRLLELPEPEEQAEEKEVRYRGKPMAPSDFKKVVESLGFEEVRESKHGTLMRRGDWIMCIQRAHRKQMMLNPSTIKKKLQESGVDLDLFEGKRRELRL